MLLTINVIAYLVWQIILINFEPSRMFVYRHLALNPTVPGIFYEPWQLVTYSFLHLSPGFGGLLHILFNMLWMLWIGREYEQMHGSHRMLALYVLGGFGGGLVTVILHSIFPGFGPFGGIVHGASGAVLGIMTAVGVQYPQKSMALMFIGTVRIIHIVFGFVFLDILFLSTGGTSVSAHAGGILAGFIWAKSARAGVDLSGWAKIFFPTGSSRDRRGILHSLEDWFESRNRRGSKSRPDQERDTRVPGGNVSPSRTDSESDIDAILDKISEKGYDALTTEEKTTLYDASKDE
ncbi:MAG: rhomboid family intramembrane serine protease [Rhodothermia bacterium]|nr:MAG: rhomboid family intramembrane serine protease [Rhodothermia bacterium]